jgi:hypothetical protein
MLNMSLKLLMTPKTLAGIFATIKGKATIIYRVLKTVHIYLRLDFKTI